MTMEKIGKTLKHVTSKHKAFWQGLALFLLFFGTLALVQFGSPGLVGNDGYYHIKLADLIRTEGFKPPFDYLPLTVLNAEEFVDHHYLFHLLMVPFTFGDLRLGAKWVSVLIPALAFTAVWWLLKKRSVPYPALWAVGLLAVSEAFLYRMSMPRAQSLSLLLLVIALLAMLEGRRWLLLGLGFLYVWSYNAFPLLLIVAGAVTAARWLVEKKLRWEPLLFSAAGIALGLVVNPYFPENLAFIYRHLMPKLLDATALSVGNEWFPYTTAGLLENSGLALLAFMSAVLALGLNPRKLNLEIAASLFLAVIFSAMLFQSRRFVEYAPAFMLIFAAFAWSPILRAWREASTRQPSVDPVAQQPWQKIKGIIIPAVIALMLAGSLWMTLSAARKNIQSSNRPYQRYQAASGWLIENTPPGSRVFQTDWDDFPQLFFYNTHNTYTLGLDPTYMQLVDEDLYERWIAITDGDVENPSKTIAAQFGASYILTDLNHKDFIRQAERDPALTLVYEDKYAQIYTIGE